MTNKRVWNDKIFSVPRAISDHRQNIKSVLINNYYNVDQLAKINIRISYTFIIDKLRLTQKLDRYLIEIKPSAKLISCSLI